MRVAINDVFGTYHNTVEVEDTDDPEEIAKNILKLSPLLKKYIIGYFLKVDKKHNNKDPVKLKNQRAKACLFMNEILEHHDDLNQKWGATGFYINRLCEIYDLFHIETQMVEYRGKQERQYRDALRVILTKEESEEYAKLQNSAYK